MQPIFEVVETAIRHRLRSPPRPWVLRILFRSAYVAAVTFLACLLPFFGDLMGLISSIGLMPGGWLLGGGGWIGGGGGGGEDRHRCAGGRVAWRHWAFALVAVCCSGQAGRAGRPAGLAGWVQFPVTTAGLRCHAQAAPTS